ncbi:MAG: S41 family peptidase [Gammaproteobacteria bacterium]|nr:S41 family peptidase [Gammaproteobacteria bacterium]
MRLPPSLLVVLCLLIGRAHAEEVPQQPLDAFRTFVEVYERIRQQYVEDYTDETLMQAAIEGMLSKLDPHSGYLAPADVSDLRQSTSGEFGGIGIEMDVVNGLIEVIAPIDDSPAALAGVQARDLITHIDGDIIRDVSLREAIEALRGPIGSAVTLGILRATDSGSERLEVRLERAIIRVTSVRSQRYPNDVGYLRISQFQRGTHADLIKAITALEADAPLKGLVLDLRNNPGGVLDAAIDVTDVFLDAGTIVSTKSRDPMENQTYSARTETTLVRTPLVILINGGSASASEIVAGALQDHDRAVLIGSPSFGKGSVQTILPLANQYALKLTTARYYTPSGRSIQAQGIIPTIAAKAGRVEELDESEQVREADLPKHLENGVSTKTRTPLAEDLREDNQLWQALQLLNSAQLLHRLNGG